MPLVEGALRGEGGHMPADGLERWIAVASCWGELWRRREAKAEAGGDDALRVGVDLRMSELITVRFRTVTSVF